MGAHPYQYVVEYQENVHAALERLRQEVFERGEYYGAQKRPRTPEKALELCEETGTRSILDITRISDHPDFCCAAPLGSAELEQHFGTRRQRSAWSRSATAFGSALREGRRGISSHTRGAFPETSYSSVIRLTRRRVRTHGPCRRLGGEFSFFEIGKHGTYRRRADTLSFMPDGELGQG